MDYENIAASLIEKYEQRIKYIKQLMGLIEIQKPSSMEELSRITDKLFSESKSHDQTQCIYDFINMVIKNQTA